MSLLAKGFHSAKVLISFQLILKLLNFTLNVLIARIVSPDVYGAGNIQVTLVSAAILHLSRETFRKVALKSSNAPHGLMWFSVFTTWTIAFSTFCIWPSHTNFIICSAASIEVLSEPFSISQLSNLEVKSRIIAESASTIANCLTILLTHSQGVIAFCYGQLSAALLNCLIFIYFCKAWPTSFSITPTDKSLTFTYAGIALIKFFLTEGEKLFLTLMTFNSIEQGVFALVSNLCGIICRMVFLPIEEISHLVFVKELSLKESQDGVKSVFKFIWIIGLIVAVYGRVYADIGISILYGKNWDGTSAGSALGIYCTYVMVMGINGISEAISSGISSQKQLEQRKYAMLWCFL